MYNPQCSKLLSVFSGVRVVQPSVWSVLSGVRVVQPVVGVQWGSCCSACRRCLVRFVLFSLQFSLQRSVDHCMFVFNLFLIALYCIDCSSSSNYGGGGSMSQVVGLPNNSYKPITNTAWVRARLCKLQKRVHSARSRK